METRNESPAGLKREATPIYRQWSVTSGFPLSVVQTHLETEQLRAPAFQQAQMIRVEQINQAISSAASACRRDSRYVRPSRIASSWVAAIATCLCIVLPSPLRQYCSSSASCRGGRGISSKDLRRSTGDTRSVVQSGWRTTPVTRGV